MKFNKKDWFKFGFVKSLIGLTIVYILGMSMFMTAEIKSILPIMVPLGILAIIIYSLVCGGFTILYRWAYGKLGLNFKGFLKYFVISATVPMLMSFGPGMMVVGILQGISLALAMFAYKQMGWRLPN